MPALPLSSEQIEDAKRLKALFVQHQHERRAKGQPWSQDELAELLGFGQSALSQYLNGRIPLNGDALGRFATLLDTDPGLISPRIVADERARAEETGAFSQLALDIARKLDAIADQAKRERVYIRLLRELATATRVVPPKVLPTAAAGTASKPGSPSPKRQPAPARQK